MSKQDRQGVRTPADVEIKYNLGKQFAEIELLLDAHRAAQEKITAVADKLGTDLNDIRNSFNDSIQEFWQTSAELKQTADDIKADMEITKQQFSNDAAALAADILSLTGSIEPLAEWSGDGRSGVAGFVAQADENSATLAQLVKWASEEDGSVVAAGIKQWVSENYASLEAVATVQTGLSESIAAVSQTANDNSAEIESLAELTTEHGTTIAGIQQSVSAMDARIDALVSLENDPTELLAGLSAQVSENNARVDTLASLVNGNGESIAAIRQDVSDNAAAIEAVATVSDENKTTLAGLKSAVENNYATVSMVAALEGKHEDSIAGVKSEIASTYAKAEQIAALETAFSQQVAGLRTEVSENYASFDVIADVVDETSGRITTAAIVAAVANDTSEIKISADKIDFEGSAIFKGLEDGTTEINGACITTGKISADVIDTDALLAGYATVGDLEGGVTSIDGACIRTGTIRSNNFAWAENGGIASGMSISLGYGVISSPNFTVDAAGGVYAYGTMRGNIIAETGEIGGFGISDNGLDKTFTTESGGFEHTTSIGLTNNGFSASNERAASGVVLTQQSTSIMPGAISINYVDHTANYTDFNGTFLFYSENGKSYYVYIDPETMTVKVR